jgi:capsular polysaccharide biosynthesis protein
MIEKTSKIGAYIVNENSIAPKKKLIVIVAFVTGFIFSIFFVFLRDFIIHFNDDLKELDV